MRHLYLNLRPLQLTADPTSRQVSRRRHLDGDTIVDGLTHLLAHTASDATFPLDDETKFMEVHGQGLNRALRHTGIAPLARRTRSVRHGRKTHPHFERIGDRQQGFRRTGGNARKIFTKLTGNLIGKNYRRAVCAIADNGARRAGLNAIAATRATFEKRYFVDGSRRAQPVCSDRGHRLLAGRILVKRKLPRGLGHRDHGVLQKIPTPVLRISGHDTSPRSHRQPAIYRLLRNDHRRHTRHPSLGGSHE